MGITDNVELVIIASVCIFILGSIGTALGGLSVIVVNQGISAIVLLVGLVLAIPSGIGLLVWLLKSGQRGV